MKKPDQSRAGQPAGPPFWTQSPAAALARLQARADGLSTEDARRRLAQYGPNEIAAGQSLSLLGLILTRLREPLALLLIGAGLLSALAGDHVSLIIILVMVALGVALDAIQEHRADRAAQLLKAEAALQEQALRDGQEVTIPAAGIVPGDVVLVISNSGETVEMKATVRALKNNGARLVGVSGNSASWLAGQCEAFLYAGIEREGSPLNFEPRASVLAQIYVLAALSIELQARKQITREHYNAWHPGGVIGQAMCE